MGMERLFSLLEEQKNKKLTAYVVSTNIEETIKLIAELRNNGISADFDMTNKKFTKQLEKASKVANYALILGEDEIANNTISIKDLNTSTQQTINRNELKTFLENIK